MVEKSPEIERILTAIRKAIIAEVIRQYSVPPHVVWVRDVSTCVRRSFYSRIYLREMDEKQAFKLLRGGFCTNSSWRNCRYD